MALGEIRVGDVARVLWKELRVGIICGLALGAVNFIRVYLMNRRDAMLSLTITLSLLCTLLISKSVGSTLPILAKKLKIDPALMAAPMITTIVDAASLVVFFAISKALLNI